MRARIVLELRESHIAGEGFTAYLIVGNERIAIDRLLPDEIAADDLHSRLAKEFAKHSIDLVEDLQ